jgi:succinate dehydrogenase hydrophobic anchor subunit
MPKTREAELAEQFFDVFNSLQLLLFVAHHAQGTRTVIQEVSIFVHEL